MPVLLVATTNANKVREIRQLLAGAPVQIVTLATHHQVPTIYIDRTFAEAGGLISYGASSFDQHRVTGLYVGRVLKGEKPAEMPIVRATKFEFVINLQTARTLGLTAPATLLAQADDLIE